MICDSLTLRKPLLYLLDHALEALQRLVKTLSGVIDCLRLLAIAFSDLAVCKAPCRPCLRVGLLSREDLEGFVIGIVEPLTRRLERPFLLFDLVSLDHAIAATLGLIVEIQPLGLQSAAWILSLSLTHDRSCSILAFTIQLRLLPL